MKAIVIPAVLLILGTAAGAGAARFLMPPASEPETAAPEPTAEPDHDTPAVAHDTPAPEPAATDDHGNPAPPPYVEIRDQFIIPVVEQADVRAMVVLSLGLEVTPGSEDAVQVQEPRLRAAFLQVLFDHANTGGFSGVFTASSNMRTLRHALLAAAEDTLGTAVTDVLILDLLRQDV